MQKEVKRPNQISIKFNTTQIEIRKPRSYVLYAYIFIYI